MTQHFLCHRAPLQRRLAVAAMTLCTGMAWGQTHLYPEFCQYADWAGYYGACVAVDLNNDGHCDLVTAGFGRHVTNAHGGNDIERLRMSHVLMVNPQADMLRWQAVSDALTVFNVTDRPSLCPCDINGDGLMDLLAVETTGRVATDQPYTSGFSRQGVFLGQGDGTFVPYAVQAIDAAGQATPFDMGKWLAATVCDVNNDGRPDLVGIGYQVAGSNPVLYETLNGMLVNQGNPTASGGTFLWQPLFDDGEVYHFEMAWIQHYDLNNDGLQDLIISGQMNDNAALGRTVSCIYGDRCTETHFFDIFLNDPQQPGHFRRQHLQDAARWGQNTVYAYGECAMAVGDVNSDGVPDLFLTGYCGTGRRHAVQGLYTGTLRADGTVAYTRMPSDNILPARPLNTVTGQNGFIDWDGDGHLDLYQPGWYDYYDTQTALIYANPQGTGQFTAACRLGSGSELSACFVDWNADGVPDVVEMGQSGDGNFFLSGFTHFQATLNPNTAVARPRPAAPVLQAPQTNDDGSITLSWQRPDGAQANTTFEYWVRQADGPLLTDCHSFIGGDTDGVRKVVAPGSACQALSVRLHLPPGSYDYGVQTVDASYQGSPFATGSFRVDATGLQQPAATPAAATPTYDLQGRALPTGARRGVQVAAGRKHISH